jgi:hypothetical protein
MAESSTDGSNYVVMFGGSTDWVNEHYSKETWRFGGGDFPLNCPVWYRDADGDGFGNPAVTQTQCSQPSGYVSNALDCDDANPAVGHCNTPVGPGPVTFTAPGGNASVTLPNVTSAGDTTITSGTCAAPPEGIFLTFNPVCVSIDTTASFDGDATVCISYNDSGLTLAQEQNLRMVRCPEGEACQVLPTSSQDTTANILCALTPAFSEFAVGTLVDTDGDFVPDLLDNCPTTVNFFQEDADSDGVGDACDNCANVPNPRVKPDAASYLAENPWATLTGGQRDDDMDGYGNVCDAKFTTTGVVVGPTDTAQYKASIGRDRRTLTCGTSHTLPCAIFDLNLGQNTDGVNGISPVDTARYKALIGIAPGPKCPTCPLSCQSGVTGGCP